MLKRFWLWFCSSCLLFVLSIPAYSQEKKQEEPAAQEGPAPGHSHHGEAFNEGPRQKGYLIGGTGKVHFPVTTKNPTVQKFIDQGVGQLHGFWYFEAERTFRQAAMLDPDCAIAYWGMANANYNSQINNLKRAKGFIAEAVKRKDKAGKRERMYIEGFDKFVNGKGSRGQKAKDYVKVLQQIIKDNPDDLEAEAILGYFYYAYRSSLKMTHKQVDKQLKKVLAREPMHPVHHYVIHLWDYKNPTTALPSAARCGQAAPEIAHMWHMPGHIYSRLRRYADAVWQQEASARIDHKHMMLDRYLPDQIHNFAHNNEWLIRNLMHIGKWRDALDLAKNMTELPRHPRYNTLTNRHSAFYGRQRLFTVLHDFELWDDFIDLSKTTHLEPTNIESEQIKRLRHLGIAYSRSGDRKAGQEVLKELHQRLQIAREKWKKELAEKRKQAQKKNQKKKGGKTKGKRKGRKTKRTNGTVTSLEQAINAIKGHQALVRKDYRKALALLRKAGEDALVLARVQCLAGEKDAAVKAAQAYVKSRDKQTRPLAGLVEILWLAGKKDEARKEFENLRKISGHLQFGSPVFDRLDAIARELDLPRSWRIPYRTPSDVGVRPQLDDLGPFRWQPCLAPSFSLKDADGHVHSLKEYNGKPVIVIFYLGYGCLHCAQQLQAFAPMTKKFEDAGISLLAISTDDLTGLRISEKNYKKGTFPFLLLSNSDLDVFKAYRAHDDFEKIPLHGTFLIDGQGRVRWQDISYEPFMDPNFVLAESQRLLGLDKSGH